MSDYDPTLARTFADAIQAAYNYYDNATPIALAGYTIGPSIFVYEIGSKTFFGYVATGSPNSSIATHNLVVFRGTRTQEEAAYDLQWDLKTCTLGGTAFGNAASGQYDFYTGTAYGLETSLSASMLSAVATFADPSLPLFVCGHSLGGGVATLAALDIMANGAYASGPTLYTFGGLHVGDATFVSSFTANVPLAFRVVNLADFVPQLTGLAADNTSFVHVGEQWWFISYNQYLWQNHSLDISYLSAVTSFPDRITNASPPNLPAIVTPAPTTARRPSAIEHVAHTAAAP